MRQRVAAIGAVIAAMAVIPFGALARHAAAECVVRAELDGIINAPRADYIERAIGVAAARECGAVVLAINSPGGELESTERIVRALRESPIPVIAYVSPPGARASSAGMMLVVAGHHAAMAPGTRVGARGGEPPSGVASRARSVAERSGRDPAWVDAAARRSLSATASEAVAAGIVDHVAADVPSLLAAVSPDLSDAEVVPVDMTLAESVRAGLAHPQALYVLLLLGLLGVIVELYNPGLLVPGIGGGLFLIMVAIGAASLPVDAAAVGVLALAAAFLVAELFFAARGLLFAAGVALMLLGSARWIESEEPLFFADPAVTLSWSLVIPVVAVVAVAAAVLGMQAIRQHEPPPATPHPLLGATGIAATAVGEDRGLVRIGGELWGARAGQSIAAGEPVEVVDIDDLELRVRPALARPLHRTEP